MVKVVVYFLFILTSCSLRIAQAEIEVLVAGLGRTGTMSMAVALDRLGYRSYHYVDFAHARQWAQLARREIIAEDILQLIEADGFTVLLENPSADLYREVLERRPNIKIVLTVTDSPEKFESSWKILMDTMELTERAFTLSFPSFFQWIPLFRNLKDIRCFLGTTHLELSRCALSSGWRKEPPGWLAEQYERHNRHVIDSVPRNLLLVMNVKEGWKPLCKFLGKDIPEEPFPYVTMNTTETLKELKATFLIIVYGWIPTVIVLVLGMMYIQRDLNHKRAQKAKRD